MKLETLVYEAFLSVSKVHTGEDKFAFGLYTTKTGYPLSISGATEEKIKRASLKLLGIGHPNCIKLDNREHAELTKAIIAEAYIEILSTGTSPFAIKYFWPAYLKDITKKNISEKALMLTKDFTYHLPASETGLEFDKPYNLGPVTIFNIKDWLDSVDFPPDALNTFGEDNSDWRENLKAALSDKKIKLKPLSSMLYDTVTKSKSIIKVTTTGHSKSLSYKLSTIAARTALDSISLMRNNPRSFRALTLYTERRPPILTSKILESNGFLWLPGVELSDEITPNPPGTNNTNSKQQRFLNAVAKILEGIVTSNHSCPNLCKRWSTALDWHGEACREISDSIAIAKFGTSLDVLSSGGGKTSAIANMVSNLTKIPINEIVSNHGDDLTLYKVISHIYENGRSEILHGNEVDRMTSFDELRTMAEFHSRITLITAALALDSYAGEDSKKAFCTM